MTFQTEDQVVLIAARKVLSSVGSHWAPGPNIGTHGIVLAKTNYGNLIVKFEDGFGATTEVAPECLQLVRTFEQQAHTKREPVQDPSTWLVYTSDSDTVEATTLDGSVLRTMSLPGPEHVTAETCDVVNGALVFRTGGRLIQAINANDWCSCVLLNREGEGDPR